MIRILILILAFQLYFILLRGYRNLWCRFQNIFIPRIFHDLQFLLKMCKGDCQIQLLKLHQVLSLEKHSEGRLDKQLYTKRLINCQENFRGNVERNILLFRLNTIEYLQTVKLDKYIPFDEDTDLPLLRLMRRKLVALNHDIDQLIQEGILTLYIDLNDIREQIFQNQNHPILKGIIKTMFQKFNDLLKQYFIYQEYQLRVKKNKRNHHRKSVFSVNSIYSADSQEPTETSINMQNQKILQEVQEFISAKPLAELFEEEMRKQEQKMVQTLEICRICFQSVKLYNLEKHVNNCAKRCELKLKIDTKCYQIGQCQQKLKARYKQSCEEMIDSRIDEDFRKICRLILNPKTKNGRNDTRRNSLVIFKGQYQMIDKIGNLIEDYMEEFGKDQLLEQLLNNYKQKRLLEKRLNNLEMNILHESQKIDQEPASPKSSIRKRTNSSNRIKKMIARLGNKCSNFQSTESSKLQQSIPFFIGEQIENKLEQHSQISSTQSLKIKETKEQKKVQSMRKFKSKNSLSKKIEQQEKDDFEIDLNKIKQYYSLQKIGEQNFHKHEEKSQIDLEDFQILQFLGAGAFGKVYMVRRKETKDIYALKIVPIPENDEKERLSIKNQHEIFKKIAGDHLVKAPFSFSHKNCHIFVLQYLPGGDLRKLLTDEVYFEQDKAKFYIAQIVLAIEHLHKFGIIHRDLKPQNLVIDRKGHLKLTDFGLSEFKVNKKLTESRRAEQISNQRSATRSKRKRRTALCGVNRNNMKLIGTPDYIAPQIIYQISYSNFTIDWWSLGVMAYELVIGNRPFCADTINQVVDNITKLNIQWPEVGYECDMISPEAKDFIQRLLDKDFSQRLGANGAQEIKQHPFLSGINWQQLKTSAHMCIPHHMTKRSEMVSMQENSILRKQIEEIVGKGGRKIKDFQLETVIRFDLLKSQTIENIEKRQEQTTSKIKKLKTLKILNFEKENIVQISQI